MTTVPLLVPVMVKVYVPGGVPLLPPPPLLLLQAGMSSKPVSTMPIMSMPKIFRRRVPEDFIPAPSRIPNTGRIMA